MKTQRGFSLIEVLLSTFLVVLAAMIVGLTMPAANMSRAKSDNLNKAVGMAQKQIEAIRGAGYPNATANQLLSLGLIDSVTPVSTNTFSFTNSDVAALDNPARILPSGTGTVTIEQADLDLRSITVTITWKERSGTKTFRLGTQIANI